MRAHVLLPLFAALVLLVTALSVGSPIFLAGGVLILLLVAFCWLSVRWSAASLRLRCETAPARVQRGERCLLRLTAVRRCPLPVAPMEALVHLGPCSLERLTLAEDSRGGQTVEIPFAAGHVGVSAVGVETLKVTDVFGLFEKTLHPRETFSELLVLPRPFTLEPLVFAPLDQGMGTMARATEDLSSPSDVRAFQPGDAMKKVHWKLSARRQELMVRRFEEPILPESLILMCAKTPEGPSASLIWDGLVETAASLLVRERECGHTSTLPLHGRQPCVIHSGMALQDGLERLARAEPDPGEKLEQLLAVESRRIRASGALAVVTADLTASAAQQLARLRHQGPTVRLCLVTEDPGRPDWQMLIYTLQNAGAEVDYVEVGSLPPEVEP